MDEEAIAFYKFDGLGQGLPFAIVDHEILAKGEGLFKPSLRDFHVILWFKKGRGRYFVDFEEFEFGPNTIALISKDQLHWVERPKKDWEVQSITFTNDFVYRNDFDLHHLFSFGIRCHEKGMQILNLKNADLVFLEQVSNYMKQVYQNQDSIRRANAFYHWLCLFLLHCESIQKKTEELELLAKNKDNEVLMAFDESVEKHFREEYKVDFYLHRLGLSNKSLARITKGHYNLSPKAVIHERRLLEIKRQLRGTSKAVKNIGYELHFDEPTNLVKYFKKHVGMTPNAFRSTEHS